MGYAGILTEISSHALTFLVGGALGTGTSIAKRWATTLRTKHSEAWPVSIHLEEDPRTIWANSPPWVSAPVFLPNVTSLDQVTIPPGDALETFARAIETQSGIPALYSDTQITVRSVGSSEVIFDRVRVEATEFDPGDGIIISKPVGGASLDTQRYEIQLSSFAPAVTARKLGGEPVEEFAATVSKGDPLRVHLQACPAVHEENVRVSATESPNKSGSRQKNRNSFG